jgi:hypothetical protein
MDLKLVIVEKIQTPTPPTNTYEIVITGMSGDADHYGESFQFADHDQTIEYLQILNAVFRTVLECRTRNEFNFSSYPSTGHRN